MTGGTYYVLWRSADGSLMPGMWYVAVYGMDRRRRKFLSPQYSQLGPYTSAQEAIVSAYASGADRVWRLSDGAYCHPWYLAWEQTRRDAASAEKIAAAETADRGFVESLTEVDMPVG